MAIQSLVEKTRTMGRKKGERETVLVRIFKDDAEALTQASGERRLTVASFFSTRLSKCVEKAHQEYIDDESKRLKEKGRKKGGDA